MDIHIVFGVLLLSFSMTFGATLFNSHSAGHSIQKRATWTVKDGIKDFISDVGRRETDLVLVIDRSTGMSEDRFYLQIKPLLKILVQQYAFVFPGFVRIAAITFAKDSTVVFDYISNENQTEHMTKGGLFHGDNPPWDWIVYDDDPEVAHGTNIGAGFQAANAILDQGRLNRPNVLQVVLLLSDGDYNEREDPIVVQETNALEDDNVKRFGIGFGAWLKPGSVRSILSHRSFYQDYVGWMNLTRDYPSGFVTDGTMNMPVWRLEGASEDMCPGSCADKSVCMCELYTGRTACLCQPGYTMENGACTACPLNTYKEEYGSGACINCPFGTDTDNYTAVFRHQDCKNCLFADCPDNCVNNNTCPGGPDQAMCQNSDSADDIECSCKPGWGGVDCNTNNNECDSGPCENGATCLDWANDYVCKCPLGYEGRNCEIDIDECAVEGLCLNNATCTHGINKFKCHCQTYWGGMFCQDWIKEPDPDNINQINTTTPEPILVTVVKQVNVTQKETVTEIIHLDKGTEEMLIYIIPAAVGGVLLVTVIVIIVCVVLRKQKTKPRFTERTSSVKVGHYEKNNERAKRRSVMKTMSKRFSGIWKKRTWRGTMKYFDMAGAPSAPPKRRPDLLSNPALGGTATEQSIQLEEITFDNQTIQETDGMDGWRSYIKELESGGMIDKACICKMNGDRHATNDLFKFNKKEMERVADLLEDGHEAVPLRLQGQEFYVNYNEEDLAVGMTIGSGPHASVCAVAKTNTMVIMMISDKDSVGEEKLKQEVRWISDHIKGEGY